MDAHEGYLKFRGKCRELSTQACLEDPTLRLVRGHYTCPIWRTREPHWWTVRPDGSIHDPTRLQFPSAGAGDYEEFDGMVVCEECGAKVLEASAKFASRYGFCSNQCILKYVGL